MSFMHRTSLDIPERCSTSRHRGLETSSLMPGFLFSMQTPERSCFKEAPTRLTRAFSLFVTTSRIRDLR
jgi:hypothetical protein